MSVVIDEPIIRDKLYGWIKDGRHRRLNGGNIPVHPSTLRGMLDINGWVQCDLMLALCRSDENYRATQRTANPELFNDEGGVKP